MMLEGAGIEVIDLGVDVSSEKVVDAVMSTTRPGMPFGASHHHHDGPEGHHNGLVNAGVRDKVKCW